MLTDAVRAVIADEADHLRVDGFCTCLSVAFVVEGVAAMAGDVVD